MKCHRRYVALNIIYLLSEDAGTYTVKAINRHGEANSQASLQVATRGTMSRVLVIPEQKRYNTERIEESEAYQQSLGRAEEFKSPIKDQLEILEFPLKSKKLE